MNRVPSDINVGGYFQGVYTSNISFYSQSLDVSYSCTRQTSLPQQFIEGLANASLQGRAQIVPDPFISLDDQNCNTGGLVFYLDGAHSPESMEMCARWFSHVVKEEETKCLDHLGEKSHDNGNFRQVIGHILSKVSTLP